MCSLQLYVLSLRQQFFIDRSAITQSPIPGLVGKHVIHIACGSDYSAAVTDEGELYTWGCGENGRLGHGELC